MFYVSVIQITVMFNLVKKYRVSTFHFLNLVALRELEARLIINSAQQHARNKCKSTVHARGTLDVSVFMRCTVIVFLSR